MTEGRRPNTSEVLPLGEYDRIIVSFSGGKDSLACLLHLLDLGVSRDRLELWHQCVDGDPREAGHGFMDWPVTDAYCRAVAAALGIRLRRQWRVGGFRREMLKDADRTAPVQFELEDGTIGQAGGLRGKVATRRKFPQVSPDLRVRWCSSVLKIDVASVAMNNDPAMRSGKVLFVTGERREESANRSRYAEVEAHRTSNRRRRVDHWRAILDWSEERVWSIIERYRVRPHPAYYLGWGRVSCMACIFGSPNQWASVRQIAPERFQEVAAYEADFGLTIKRGQSVAEQADRGRAFLFAPEVAAMAAGEAYDHALVLVPEGQAWERPSGAGAGPCGGAS